MSKEKQIEEMSTEIREAVNGCSSYWSGLIAEHLYEQGYRKIPTTDWLTKEVPQEQIEREKEDAFAEVAERLGYRKQSEGEWRSELVKKCDWKGKKHDYYQPNSCSLCHAAVLKRTPFCPNCGAKMKGENK